MDAEETVAKSIAVDPQGAGVRGTDGLPGWFPEWARKLAELYFSGTTSMFALHGNTFDLVRTGVEDGQVRFGTLADFVGRQLFGRWDLVLHYDLARGLRCLASDGVELRAMVELAHRKLGDLEKLRADPGLALAALDRFVRMNLVANADERVSMALVIDHASYLVPREDRRSLATSKNLVTLLNWATSPYVKRLNFAVVLLDTSVAEVSERLVSNPHVAALEVPLPDREARLEYLKVVAAGADAASFSDYSLEEVAALTAGIGLTDLAVLVRSSIESGRRLDAPRFRELKKRLIERQAQGLLEFIEPRWNLDMVVGHEAAKQRLKDDAALLKRGALDTVPMGYLFSGPVGTGKSFLAQCMAGAIGIPCVMLKNFRSKYVGESEGNLERVLGVLRGMGPVCVVIDEADTQLGDREDSGDSGISSRIFGMIASQMGDTRYRGRIVWMLLTARPDLLPIDLKRQGRAEVHIPLFYPQEEAEARQMFVVLAKKMGARLAAEDVPPIPHTGDLSGADIEGVLGRAWRKALLVGQDQITRAVLEEVLAGFMPSTQSLERRLQEIAAIIECTDREFLPAAMIERMNQYGGREKLQERLTAMKQIVESQ